MKIKIRSISGILPSYETAQWELSEELSDTERGGGGFGHTGV